MGDRAGEAAATVGVIATGAVTVSLFDEVGEAGLTSVGLTSVGLTLGVATIICAVIGFNCVIASVDVMEAADVFSVVLGVLVAVTCAVIPIMGCAAA